MRRHHTSRNLNGEMSCFGHFRRLISIYFQDDALQPQADLLRTLVRQNAQK